MNELTINAQIDNNGKLLSSEFNDLRDFKNNNKNTVVMITYKAYKPKTSEALKGFYFGKIVSDFRRFFLQKGYHYSRAKTEYEMRCLIPIMRQEFINEETGKIIWHLREFNELDDPDKLFYIERLKQFTAENGYIISDETTWRKSPKLIT